MFSFDFLRSGESNCRLFFGPPWCLMTNWFPKLTFGSVISTSNLAKSVQYERVLVTTSSEWNTMVCWLCTVVPVRSQRSERNKVHYYVLRVRVRVHVVVYSTWESNRIIMKLEMAAIVGSVPAGNERIIVQKEQERNGRMLAQSSNDVLGFCFSTLFARTAADLVLC